jgi:hypothetical protein
MVVVAAAVATSGSFAAYATWAIPGAGAVKTRAASVPRGVVPSVAKVGKKAVVSWSAQEIASGVKMKSYVVTAHRVDGPASQDLTRTVAASGGASDSVTFAPNEVAGGKWRWTVVPRFGSWAGAESGLSDALTFAVPAPPRAADPEPPAPVPTSAPAAAETPKEPEPSAEPTTSSPTPVPSPTETISVSPSATLFAEPIPRLG